MLRILTIIVVLSFLAGCGNDDENVNPLAPTDTGSAVLGSAMGTPVASIGELDATHEMGEAGFGPLLSLPNSFTTTCSPSQQLVDRAERFRRMNDRPPGYAKNWRQVLVYFGQDWPGVSPVTREQLEVRVTRWNGWRPFLNEYNRLDACGYSPTTTIVIEEPEPEPVVEAGTAYFIGGNALGATATSSPVMAVMGEDDHYGVEFSIARSGSNRVCLDGVGSWTSSEFNFRIYGLDSENCIEEGKWENGQATIRGFGNAIDNNIVDPDRFLGLSIKSTSETTPAGGPFHLTIINDDWLWVGGERRGNTVSVSLQRPIGGTVVIRATMTGPAWTRGSGDFHTRTVNAPGNDPNPFTINNPRNCSNGAAWVTIGAFPGNRSGMRQEHLKVYNGRYNLC